MSRSAGLVLGAALVLAGVLALVVQLAAGGERTDRTSIAGVTRLEFDVDNGPMEIVAGGDEAVVDVTASTGWLGGEVEVDEVDGTLRVEHRCPGWFAVSCRASVSVSLPPGTTVAGSSSNGGITLTGLDAPVDVGTSNGEVVLRDLSSTVRVRTSNGAVTGERLRVVGLDVGTSNGRIDLRFAAAPSDVELDTSNGSVDVLLPAESPPYALSTETSNGSVDAAVRTDPSAERSIRIETSNGSITVGYGG